MAIYVEWEFYMGGFDGTITTNDGIPYDATDFTSRVVDISYNASVEVGKVGSASASVRLNNADGAFTPTGSGTYADWDYFANPVFIRAKSGTNPASLTAQPPLFAGLVSDVQFYDDGFDSYIDLDCDDAFVLLGRLATNADYDNLLDSKPIWEISTDIVNNYTATGAIPKFGSFFTYYNNEAISPESFNRSGVDAGTTGAELEISADAGSFVGDLVGDFAVAEHGVVFPMFMDFQTIFGFPGNSVLYYQHGFLARDWLWSGTSTYGADDEFHFKKVDLTGAELPFYQPKIGYNVEQVITNADTAVIGGLIQQSVNSTSLAAYGPRTAEFTELPMAYDSQALELAEHLTTRYDTVRFGVLQITTSGGAIRSKCADTALAQVNRLLRAPTVGVYGSNDQGKVLGALFSPMFIEFNGAGGVSLDSRVAFTKVSFSIGSIDWEMTLSDGHPALETFGFVLGEDEYGVIGTNKVA